MMKLLCLCVGVIASCGYRLKKAFDEGQASVNEGDAEQISCSTETYYNGVDTSSLAAIKDLVKRGARRLSYRAVYRALTELDQNKDNSAYVDMLYSKYPQKASSKPHWNREHLWPKSYGVSCKRKSGDYVESNGPFTDLHHLFPTDTKVNADRSSEYFDECTEATCHYPANPDDGYTAAEKQSGEAKDESFWMPPEKSRGVVARALFFMALRYDGSEENTFDLVLSDCPQYCKYALGRLSVLKRWHEAYPPTEAETIRNSKVCAKQGNRNPFIDKPELVERFFGSSRYSELVDSSGCHSCRRPTPVAKYCAAASSGGESRPTPSPPPAPSGSCRSYGCGMYRRSHSCQCNDNCAKYQNCCGDFTQTCATGTGSCQSYGCSHKAKRSNKCQCNPGCTYFGDCCSDYMSVCKRG